MDPSETAVVVRHGAGTIAGSRSILQVTGPEKLPFLDGLVTADIKVLPPGRCAYAALLNDRGRVLADLNVLNVGEGYLIDVDRDLGPKVLGLLNSSRVSEAVDVLDRTGDFDSMYVVGAGAPDAVGRLGLQIPPAGHWVEGVEMIASRLDDLGLPVVALAAAPERIASASRRLQESGCVPFGRETWEVLRLEAGVPKYGVDFDEGTLALEAPIRRGIALDKGCYVGQEIVARLVHRGQLKRTLVSLIVDGMPPPGAAILQGSSVVGRLTSAAYSRALSATVALGFVPADGDQPGARFTVDAPGGRVPAVVSAVPLVA